jgi:hypothetical protein
MNSTTHIQTVEIMPIVTNLEPISSICLVNRKKKPDNPNFDELILETVDSTFSTLGDSCKQAIYNHLENSYGLKREAIPRNIAAFAHALEDIFGQAALLLEARIIRALHGKVHDFKYFPKQKELSFATYLENFRSYI